MESLMTETEPYSFNAMYESYYKRIYHVSWNITQDSYLAEDVVQETFVKAYRNLSCLDDSNKIGAWLSTIATRTAIDMLRKEKRNRYISIDSLLFTEQNNQLPLCDVDKEIDLLFKKEEIQEEAIRLSPKLRHVFLLKFSKELKDKEIAMELNISMSAVKTRIYRAKKLIKSQLEHQREKQEDEIRVIGA